MKDELVLGIDEAGMGPVFGPLIISGVVIKKKDESRLREIGVKDSKMFGSGLTAHKKREDVWAAAKPYLVAEKQVIIEAAELDQFNMYELHINGVRNILKSFLFVLL